MINSIHHITVRVDSETQELLSEATTIMGMSSIKSFVVNSAIEKAKEIVQRERVLTLSERDAILLIDTLDLSAKPNARLQQASKNYVGNV